MPRSKTQKLYNKFSKGIITEAGYLNYPEDASVDELNTVVGKKGNRYRRQGLAFEGNSQPKALGMSSTSVMDEFVWKAVAKDGGLNYLVIRNGLYVYFFDMSASPLSNGQKSFQINLNDFAAPNATTDSIATSHCRMVSGKGYLFICNPYTDPIICEYKKPTDSLTTTKILIQIRDFDGLDDNLANDQEPSTLSSEHQYNLQNQGWVKSDGSSTYAYTNPYTGQTNTETGASSGATDPINQFHTVLGKYPGNNKQWWVAKATADQVLKGSDNNLKQGDFLPKVLDKLYGGNTRAPQGHYILSAFLKDRSSVSGIANLPSEVTEERPNSLAFFSGRVWFGCNNTVYFSQILSTVDKAGKCYQQADPTAEDISDLLATDGGVLQIPDIGNITAMVPNGDGVLVFGLNGVFSISGTQGGFTAKDYSTSRVSPIGMRNPQSIVQTDEAIFWWGDAGIMGLKATVGQYGGTSQVSNVSLSTIQTFYNDIDPNIKTEVKSVYDPNNNLIMWLYGDTIYDQVLNFDLTLEAFYPWKFASSSTYYVKGIYVSERLSNTTNVDTVVVNGDPVISNLQPVIVDYSPTGLQPSRVEFTIGDVSGNLCFGQVNDGKLVDWGTEGYDSYIETGYELFQDAMRRKNLTYVFVYLEQTEKEWFYDSSGSPQLDDPSSCQMQIRWDWASSSKSNKWTEPVQVYRPGRFLAMDSDGSYDTGFPLIVTKNKVRGNGKSIQFRFGTSEPGRNFNLLGWSVAVTGETVA
jgi:hypothetical protein